MIISIERCDYTQTNHAELLLFLLNQYALDPMGGGEALSEYTQRHLAQALSQRSDVFSFFLKVNDKPAGLINLIEGFSTFKCKPVMNIHDVVVLSEYRGRGLVKHLLQAAENFAAERGCCKLTLEVLQGNEPAKKAYKNFGFSGYELDPTMGHAEFWEKPIKD
jgi:ribosomal protein S18 acetylase RimI-like enzyme